MQQVLTLRFPRPAPRPGRGLGLLTRVRVRAAHRRAVAGGHLEAAAVKPESAVPFIVGRMGKDDKRMLVLDSNQGSPPIPGPWDLRAVFSK